MGSQFTTLKEHKSLHPLFLILFAMTFTFTNFGPNGTTYIIPAEIFPAEIRGTFNGISAASGKLGATITSFTFKTIEKAHGLSTIFYICSVVGLLGLLVTIFFTPNYSPKKLDDIDEEPEDRFEALFDKCIARPMPRYLPDEKESKGRTLNVPWQQVP